MMAYALKDGKEVLWLASWVARGAVTAGCDMRRAGGVVVGSQLSGVHGQKGRSFTAMEDVFRGVALSPTLCAILDR